MPGHLSQVAACPSCWWHRAATNTARQLHQPATCCIATAISCTCGWIRPLGNYRHGAETCCNMCRARSPQLQARGTGQAQWLPLRGHQAATGQSDVCISQPTAALRSLMQQPAAEKLFPEANRPIPPRHPAVRTLPAGAAGQLSQQTPWSSVQCVLHLVICEFAAAWLLSTVPAD